MTTNIYWNAMLMSLTLIIFKHQIKIFTEQNYDEDFVRELCLSTSFEVTKEIIKRIKRKKHSATGIHRWSSFAVRQAKQLNTINPNTHRHWRLPFMAFEYRAEILLRQDNRPSVRCQTAVQRPTCDRRHL